MVKSYQGVITKEKVTSNPSIKVTDYMSKNLITFTPDQTMYEVIKTLIKHRISGAPVVNDQHELIGIISEGDCLKEVKRGKYDNYPNLAGKLADYMTTKVVTITQDTNVFDAAEMFLSRRIRRFPVLDAHGILIGQISQKDVMRAVLMLKSENW